MASITVTTQEATAPPVTMLIAHASPGCLFQSLAVTRIQDGSETLIRRQPSVGTSDALAYDYEPRYGVPATYRMSGVEQQNSLSSNWVGTANNSASTLSKDGSVIATNLDMNPQNLVKRSVWQATATQNSDGTWTYSLSGSVTNGTFYCATAGNVGDVLRITFKEDISSRTFGSEGLSSITKIDSHTIYATINRTAAPTLSVTNGNLTPITTLRITPADYQAMQALGVDWFAGDTYQIGATNTFDTTSSAVTITPQQGWLVHPGNPAKSMPLPMGRVTGFSSVGRGMNATRHDVLGATLPVYTISGPRSGLQFTLELRTRTQDEENMLWALLDDQIPILIDWLDVDAQRLNLQPMYVQVGDMQQSRFVQMLYEANTQNTPADWREWQLPCIQVQSPAISQQAVGWTYADLLAEQSSYLSVRSAYGTYADLQAHDSEGGD